MSYKTSEDYQEFKRCVDILFTIEGYYSNDPVDRGGETKYGISKKAYPHLDIKNLTKEKAEELYYYDYWYTLCCEQLDFPDSLLVFDSGVNHGVPRVIKWVRLLKTWKDLIPLRREFYKRIIERNPSQKRFEFGWKNRIDKIEKIYNEAIL
jgi:hypothetical protein